MDRDHYVYTPEELTAIEQTLSELLNHIYRHGPKPLPMCIRFCSIIKKNIGTCRAEGWNDRDVLSEYIRDDWRCAMALHAGLPDYYIPDPDYDTQLRLNEPIDRGIVTLSALIEGHNL